MRKKTSTITPTTPRSCDTPPSCDVNTTDPIAATDNDTDNDTDNAISVKIDNTENVTMIRGIGFFSAIGIMTGSIIGSGIFVAPVTILRHCNSVGLSLLVWVVCGILTIGKVMCYIELGMIFPRAGGDYAFIREINGKLPAFIFGWMLLLIIEPCNHAIMSQIAVDYLLEAIYGDCTYLSPIGYKLMCAWLIITVVSLNCLYVRYVTRVQNFLSMLKIGALVMIIVSGAIYLSKGNVENFKDPFKASNWNPGDISLAVYSGLYSYSGWKHIFILIEEVKNPQKKIPLATITSILLVMVLYVFTNIAYMGAIDPDIMMKSKAVAMTFSDVTMSKFTKVVPFFVACSTIGSLNSAVLGSSRVLFAASRDKLLPMEFTMTNLKYLTPTFSIWIVCLISLVYLVLFDAMSLIEYQTFAALLFQIMVFYDVVYLRYSRPHLHRPYRVWLFIPILLGIFTGSITLLGLLRDPMRLGISIVLMLAGLPLYWVFISARLRPLWITKPWGICSRTIQKLFMVVPQTLNK